MFRITVTLLLTLLLAGCDFLAQFKTVTVASICKEYPHLCKDLNPDAHCRYEKAEIIRTRYAHIKAPSDPLKYQLLLLFEDYKECVSLAAQIEHIKLKEKKSGRVKGMLTAQREIRQLSRDTEESDYPYLMYYHWSRYGSEEALERFLALQGTKQLEEPDLQKFLAEHFVKFDLEKTVEILHHALELYDSGDEVDPEIFYSLSTIYLKLDKFAKAYLWGYIAKDFDITDLDLGQIEAIVIQQNKSPGQIETIANRYISDIKSGTFVAPGL